MTLKKYYLDAKKGNKDTKELIINTLRGFVCLGFVCFLVSLGWHNLIVKIFNAPDISYFQMIGIIIWVKLIGLLFFGVTKHE